MNTLRFVKVYLLFTGPVRDLASGFMSLQRHSRPRVHARHPTARTLQLLARPDRMRLALAVPGGPALRGAGRVTAPQAPGRLRSRRPVLSHGRHLFPRTAGGAPVTRGGPIAPVRVHLPRGGADVPQAGLAENPR